MESIVTSYSLLYIVRVFRICTDKNVDKTKQKFAAATIYCCFVNDNDL